MDDPPTAPAPDFAGLDVSGLVAINQLANGLHRLTRTTPANNSPAEIQRIAHHCLENLADYLSGLREATERMGADLRGATTFPGMPQ